jgi:hypothetical protein
VTHVHCKDVSPVLAAAMRGKDTGISASIVPIGKGANGDTISKCIKILEARKWNGVFCIESDGKKNVIDSAAWLRAQIEKQRSKGGFSRQGVSPRLPAAIFARVPIEQSEGGSRSEKSLL